MQTELFDVDDKEAPSMYCSPDHPNQNLAAIARNDLNMTEDAMSKDNQLKVDLLHVAIVDIYCNLKK